MLIVYSGKPSEEPGPYYIQGTLPSAKPLVIQLNNFVDLTSRNISLDRLYTSVELFEWLLSEGITALGTIDASRRGIVPEIKATTEKQDKSFELYWEKLMVNFVSTYVTHTKSKGMKSVLLLSTVSPLWGITNDDSRKKTAIHKLYNFTKGGTDIIDRRTQFYSVNTKSLKWTVNGFSHILDSARVNSQTFFQ